MNEDLRVIRFADSINNYIAGPSVSNWNQICIQEGLGILPETHLITYVETQHRYNYPGVEVHEVNLADLSPEVASRMPAQPHFTAVNEALNAIKGLDGRIVAYAVSARWSPQAHQFSKFIKDVWKRDCPLVIEGHGSDVCGYQFRTFEALFSHVFSSADRVIIAETPFAKGYLKSEGYGVDNMMVLPTVVDWKNEIDKVRDTPILVDNTRERYEREFGIPADAPLVLTIGRFQPEKGHEYLAKASEYILKEHPEVYFGLGGGGDGTIPDLKDSIKTGHVKIIDRIPFRDFYPLIASCEAFVIASKEVWERGKLYFAETGPRTIVEAFATSTLRDLGLGCVTIATRSGGTPYKFNMDEWFDTAKIPHSDVPECPEFEELDVNVENAAGHGILVKQEDPEAMARGINLLLEDSTLKKRLLKNTERYVERWYDPKMLAREFRNVLDEV